MLLKSVITQEEVINSWIPFFCFADTMLGSAVQDDNQE